MPGFHAIFPARSLENAPSLGDHDRAIEEMKYGNSSRKLRSDRFRRNRDLFLVSGAMIRNQGVSHQFTSLQTQTFALSSIETTEGSSALLAWCVVSMGRCIILE